MAEHGTTPNPPLSEPSPTKEKVLANNQAKGCVTPDLRECLSCRQTKPITEFYKDTRSDPNGRMGICKKCRQTINKKWAEKNPIRYYCSMLLTQAKRRQETRGHCVSPELSVDYLLSIATPNCPITGEPMLWEYSHGMGLNSNSPSLDRIDSSKGYEPGNVRIVSHRINAVKNNLTLDQINALHALMNGTREADKGGSFGDMEITLAQVTRPVYRSKHGLRDSPQRLETINRLRDLRDKGHTIRDIAKIVGMGRSTVHALLKEDSGDV